MEQPKISLDHQSVQVSIPWVPSTAVERSFTPYSHSRLVTAHATRALFANAPLALLALLVLAFTLLL